MPHSPQRTRRETASEPFYTVTQLGAELGITVRTLHFYEAQGLLTPRRAGTTRVYTQRDRARMILILRGKRLGFSIREIREYLELYDADPTQGEQVKALLKSVHNRLRRLEEQRVALEETLAELRGIEREAALALRARAGAPAASNAGADRIVPKSSRPKTRAEAKSRANAAGAN